jgi:hypothetical protein
MYKEPIATLPPLKGRQGLTNPIDLYPKGTTPEEIDRGKKDPEHLYAVIIPIDGEPDSFPTAAILKYGGGNVSLGWVALQRLDDGQIMVKQKS